MTSTVWGLALAAALGLLTGIAVCLLALAVIRSIRTLPMDGRTYTGDLGPIVTDSDDQPTPDAGYDEADQFLRDLNRQGDRG